MEQTSVRDGVLHGVTGFIRIDLPAQTTATCRIVPSIDLSVVNALGQSEPGVSGGAVGEFDLGSSDGGKTPEHLIVVTLIDSEKSQTIVQAQEGMGIVMSLTK